MRRTCQRYCKKSCRRGNSKRGGGLLYGMNLQFHRCNVVKGNHGSPNINDVFVAPVNYHFARRLIDIDWLIQAIGGF
jgi:hypothetical protein